MEIEKCYQIAKACHQLNKTICELDGDFSQVDWHSAPDWQRDSAIKGVQFRLDHPDGPESAQHDAWAQEKIAAGWVYGVEKNAILKTHPCLVPFSALPPMQRLKDAVFCAVVDTLKS